MGPFSKTPSTNAADAAARQREGELVFDVREKAEFKAGHIQRAVHIPLGQLQKRIGELPTNRGIIVVCASGARSASATKLLNGSGRTATNLSGGMYAWQTAGLPMVSRGRVA